MKSKDVEGGDRVENRIDPNQSGQGASLQRSLSVSCHGLSHPGRARARNEDQFVVADLKRVLQVRQSSVVQPSALYSEQLEHLFIVADGLRGHRAGEYASALAVMSLENMLLNTIGWLFRFKGKGALLEFQEALRTADRWVTEAAAAEPGMANMGSTVTMAYATGRFLYIAHVGDTRCYRWRQGRLDRLTRDHTLVEAILDQGLLSAAEAAQHDLPHIVTNAVGGGTSGVVPEVHRHELVDEDLLLLCTDGLTEMLSDQQIAALLERSHASPEEACRRLVDEANTRGGRDNITVVIAGFHATNPAQAQ
jgi:serine/threonine protein phosphatase PrpC